MKKKLVAALSTCLLASVTFAFVMGEAGSVSCDAYPGEGVVTPVVQQLRVIVNGNELIGADPQIINGSTMVPVRAIFEALGATVDWNSASRTATGKAGDTEVEITIDSSVAYVDGEPVSLAQPAVISDGRTLVPARFISEALGADVEWNANTKTVVISE